LREASASELLMRCRKRIRRCQNRRVTFLRISLGDPETAQAASGMKAARSSIWLCTEREYLAGDAKGKGASGSNREAAPERGGLPCSSDEAGVMLVERRGQVTDVGSEPTGNRRSSNSRRKAAAFVRWHEPDDARVSSPDLSEARGEIPRAYSAKCEVSAASSNVRV
jgi:hypothetical protein